MTAADRPSVTDNARAEAERRYGTPDFAVPNDRTIKYAAFIEGAEWAAARAETTTATDEDAARVRAQIAVLLTQHAQSVLVREGMFDSDETSEAVDAILALLATARTRPTRQQVIDVLREKDPDNHDGWHSPAAHYYEAQADAVLALYADQPTEAEAGARALEQAAEAVYTDSVPSLAPWLLTRAARIRAGGA